MKSNWLLILTLVFAILLTSLQCNRDRSPLNPDVSAYSLIKDPELARQIRETLYLSSVQLLTAPELERLDKLRCWPPGYIYSLDGIEYCLNLEQLYLWNLKTTDLSPLRSLQKVVDLRIIAERITDLSPLVEMINLNKLNAYADESFDVSLLPQCSKLKWLSIQPAPANISSFTKFSYLKRIIFQDGELPDLSPLRDLSIESVGLWHVHISAIENLLNVVKTDRLRIRDCDLKDVSFLDQFKNLVELDLGKNQITFIPSLKDMRQLKIIQLYENELSDLSFLTNTFSITYYSLLHNHITDISPLMNTLEAGDFIDISENPLNEQTINVLIPELESKGVEVILVH